MDATGVSERQTSAGLKLSVRRLLLNDYPSSLAWMFIVIFWLMSVFAPQARQLLAESWWIAFLVILAIALATVLMWRIHRASRLFQSGRVTEARITSVWVSQKGPITFDFAFDHEGHRVRTRMHVVRWKRKAALKRDQTVGVLYDPTHPTRAIIARLFQA